MSEGTGRSTDVTWRAGRLPLLVYLIGGLSLVWVGVMLAQDGAPIESACAVLGGFVLAWRLGWHPHVRLTDSHLVVVNPFRTVRISLRDIDGVSPGYYGVVIGRKAGRAVTAHAVQQANIASWFGWRTSSVVFCEQVQERIARLPD